MAEHHSGPVEVGAAMDYAEHDKSYGLFINGAKYGSMIIVCLLIAMAAGFFTTVGWYGIILFVILCIAGFVIL